MWIVRGRCARSHYAAELHKDWFGIATGISVVLTSIGVALGFIVITPHRDRLNVRLVLVLVIMGILTGWLVFLLPTVRGISKLFRRG